MEGILSHNQHGFRKSKLCVTQLLDFVHSIADTLDNGGQTDVLLYLDMAKAFDKVPHKKFIYKLEMYGIQNPLKFILERSSFRNTARLNFGADFIHNIHHRHITEFIRAYSAPTLCR